MGLFKKKHDPIAERAEALNQQIAALEAQIQGLAVQVNWSSNADTAATLSVYIHASTATGADTTAALIAQKATIAVENAGEYIVPFVAMECRSICVKFDVAGTDSTVTCTFTAYVVKNVGEAWTRASRTW